MCSYADEVVAPYMIRVRWPQPHARSIVQPQPAARLLPLRYLQPLTTPDAFHTILAHLPAIVYEQRRDPAIPATHILVDGLCETIFVFVMFAQ
jgi:hypothetical protein